MYPNLVNAILKYDWPTGEGFVNRHFKRIEKIIGVSWMRYFESIAEYYLYGGPYPSEWKMAPIGGIMDVLGWKAGYIITESVFGKSYPFVVKTIMERQFGFGINPDIVKRGIICTIAYDLPMNMIAALNFVFKGACERRWKDEGITFGGKCDSLSLNGVMEFVMPDGKREVIGEVKGISYNIETRQLPGWCKYFDRSSCYCKYANKVCPLLFSNPVKCEEYEKQIW